MTDDWRKPYRTRDAAGCPTDAAIVGWAWITELGQARVAAGDDVNILSIEHDVQTAALYRGTELLAAATTFRDAMNFAVLIRWKADA